MTSNVQSELIMRGDLAQLILSSWQVNEQIVSQLPLEAVEIYRTGFRAALKSIATAYGLNIPELREAEAAAHRRLRRPSQYDMRL